VKKKVIVIGLILAVALVGGIYYLTSQSKSGDAEHSVDNETGLMDGNAGAHEEGKDGHKEEKEGHEGHDEEGNVKMAAEVQKQNGVVVAAAKKQRMAGVISVTGKVEANADKIAHVSPRICGNIVSVKASLGDGVSAGQSLAPLDSVELGEAFGRQH